MLLQLFQFFSLSPPLPGTPIPTSIPHPLVHVHGSYIWVLWLLHFLYFFKISPCLFHIYQLCFLFLVPFLSFFPLPLGADNLPIDLHINDSVPLLVVCTFCVLDSVVDSCEFVAILMVIVLFFFFKQVPLTFHVIMAWWWWTPSALPCLGSTLSALQF